MSCINNTDNLHAPKHTVITVDSNIYSSLECGFITLHHNNPDWLHVPVLMVCILTTQNRHASADVTGFNMKVNKWLDLWCLR